MNASFGAGDQTRFQAARDAILRVARLSPHDAIAVRFAGGTQCTTEYQDPEIGFERNQASRIEDALSDVAPVGQSDTATAIAQAVQDFSGSKLADSADAHQILAFLGSTKDRCTTGDWEHAVVDTLEGSEFGTNVRFTFIGVGGSQADRFRLRHLKRLFLGQRYTVETLTPQNVPELQHDVEEAVQGAHPSNQVRPTESGG
jgi:hypothetical protein